MDRKQNKKSPFLIKRIYNIFLVEDHPVFKYGLTQLITQYDNLKVLGDSDSAGDAIEKIKDLNPDLIILDLNLNNSSGFDLLKDILAYDKKMKVLILSMFEDITLVERAFRIGARGYLNKKETFSLVVQAIHDILEGKFFITEEISKNMIQNIACGGSELQGAAAGILTDREFMVFRLIGEGKDTKVIARELNLSINTINTYKERIKEKLHLKNFTNLIQTAVKWYNNTY